MLDPSAFGPAGGAELSKGRTPRSNDAKAPPRSIGRMAGNIYSRPLYWAGRLAGEKSGHSYTCSAQLVAPGIIATAAHCVRDEWTGTFFSNVLYQHQYLAGVSARDLGAECMATYNNWVSSAFSKRRWDYATVRLSGGKDLGHFGWQYNWWGVHGRAPKIGYPVGIDGAEMIQVDYGNLIDPGWDGIVGLRHNNPRNQEGSSGGAWVGRYDTSDSPQGNWVISVTSFRAENDLSTSYGPYWDDNFVRLINTAQTGCR